MKDGIQTIIGKKPGKTISILAGIHGDETCGIEAFKEIIPTLSIERGKVHFIYGNLLAIKKKTRFIEMNLNRAFKPKEMLSAKEMESYERKRAEIIMAYLDESEASLDIHSSKTKNSSPFIICEPKSFHIAERISFPIKSFGWDDLEPGGTDYYMNKKGGFGLCVECGYHFDTSSIEIAKQAIVDFLILHNIISGQIPGKNNAQKTIQAYKIYHTKNNFIPAKNFSDFGLLKKGEFLGKDGDEKIYAPQENKNLIIFCRKREKAGQEAFILGREVN